MSNIQSLPANLPCHLKSANTGLDAGKVEATPARWLVDNGTIVKLGQSSSDSSPATHHSMEQGLRWLSFIFSHKARCALQHPKDFILPGEELSAIS